MIDNRETVGKSWVHHSGRILFRAEAEGQIPVGVQSQRMGAVAGLAAGINLLWYGITWVSSRSTGEGVEKGSKQERRDILDDAGDWCAAEAVFSLYSPYLVVGICIDGARRCILH